MRRRDFVTGIAGSAAAWPLTARAQQSTLPVIGFLSFGSSETSAHLVAAFRKGLGETGYAEGQNVSIDFRWAQHKCDRVRFEIALPWDSSPSCCSTSGLADPA